MYPHVSLRRSFTYSLRLPVLISMITGLHYVGNVTNDTWTCHVYSNLKVTYRDAYHIEFEGGVIVTEDGFITKGRKHGSILTIRYHHLRRHSITRCI